MKTSKSMVLGAMFCLGYFSVLAQVLFMREMMVVFSGNEMSIGTIMAGWLFGIGLGAFMARFVFLKGSSRVYLVGMLVLVALLLPLQIYIIRVARDIFNVPVGELVSFPVIFAGSFLIFLPSCFCIGFAFPLICEIAGDDLHMSRIYAIESLGSMAGGVLLTFLLLPYLSVYEILFTGSVAALLAALLIAGRRKGVFVAGCVLLLLTVGLLFGRDWIARLEADADRARWIASGFLTDEATAGDGPRLVCSDDTKYQNIAVIESQGQYTMLGHGRVKFSFPDPIAYEHDIHFIMGQNPDAKKVLLIGGNPVGDIPELLKYTLERIVYIELDPGVDAMLRKVVSDKYDMVVSDKRVHVVYGDAARFAGMCNEEFDVVIVNVSEPSSAWENRVFTAEFYRSIQALLSDDGFLYTAVDLSERLRSSTADLGASIYKTLKTVFPLVLVTAGERSKFFAGGNKSCVTFDRQILYERSRSAALANKYFRPEYFLSDDGLDPEKIKYVQDRFAETDAPLNTNSRPVTYYYGLLVWGEKNSAGAGKLMRLAGMMRPWHVVVFMLFFGAIGLVYGMAQKTSSGWGRKVAGLIIGTTGFCGMAMEIVLIFIFQAVFGYVYARIGMIVAMFMMGLVLGSSSGKILCSMARGLRTSGVVLCLESLILVTVLCIPFLSMMASESAMYCVVMLVGWLVGAEFPVCNRMFREAGGSLRGAAAVTDASDHIGAALGALVTGILLVPVLGIASTCMILAALKIAGIMILLTVRSG